MWVTCYTDASWRIDHGALAYWLKSNRGRVVDAASCTSDVVCSNTAEFAAILAGVTRALTEWDDVEGIQINTDSQTAISYLQFSAELSRLRRKEWLVFRTRLYTMLDERGCKIQFKHVRGHQRPTHVRAYINDHVDALARRKNR